MQKICAFNFKGGTGKTSTIVNLAAALAKLGFKVLLVDLDKQRSASFYLEVDGKAPTIIDWLLEEIFEPIATEIENLSVIPGDFRIKDIELEEGELLIPPAIEKIEGFDICLLDCPPDIQFESVQAIMASDRVILPVVCSSLDVKGLAEATQIIREINPTQNIDILRNKHWKNKKGYKKNNRVLIDSQKDEGYNLIETIIPSNADIEYSVDEKTSVIYSSPYSAGAKAYRALAEEYLNIFHDCGLFEGVTING